MTNRPASILIFTCLLSFPVIAQNYYPGVYGEGGAGGIYTSVNGGPETGPEPAMISVARTNSSRLRRGSHDCLNHELVGGGRDPEHLHKPEPPLLL